MAKVREINGREFPRREFVNYLIKGIAQADPEMPTVQALIVFFGDDDWDCREARDRLKAELIQLDKRGLVERVAPGRYRVKEGRVAKGLSEDHRIEADVIEFLRENGGIARWRDLLKHFDMTEKTGGEALRRTLTKSARVRRDYSLGDLRFGDQTPEYRVKSITGGRQGRGKRIGTRITVKRPRLRNEKGYLNLHPRELRNMVLEGRWVARHIKMALYAMPEDQGMLSSLPHLDLSDAFLRRVGAGFAGVREMNAYTLDEVVDRDGVRQALDEAVLRYTDRDVVKDLDDHDQRVHLLARFEGGLDDDGEDLWRYAAHNAMRTDFYIAMAGIYNLDAAEFSRGVLTPDVDYDDTTGWEDFFNMIDEGRAEAEDDPVDGS